MTEYLPVEVDIVAMVFHVEDMPNSKPEIAKELGITENKLTQILRNSDILKDSGDGFIRRKLYRDDMGKWQVVFPKRKVCDQCDREIPVLEKYYIQNDSLTKTTICEKCVKKKQMLQGLEGEEDDSETRIGMFGSSGSGKTHQVFNRWRK